MRFLLAFCGTRTLIVLFLSSFAILVLDILGIALIFPFLNFIIEPQSLLANQTAKRIYQWFGFSNVNEFVFSLGVALIVAYLLKLAGKTVLNSIKNRATADVTYRLSSHLFMGLLGARYALFAEHGISEMTNIVNAQSIHSVICLESFVKIVNELTFLLLVLVVALSFNPFMTFLAVLVFAGLGMLVYLSLIKRIEGFGRLHATLNVLVYKYGFAMANSIKDIKIMRLEHKYTDKFTQIWRQYSTNDSRSKTAKGVPVDLSETLIFCGIVLVCLYMLTTNQEIKEKIPLLGVLMVTAVRILPSFNRIISSYNEFRFYKPALSLVKDLSDKVGINQQQIEHLELPFTKTLAVQGLEFRYGEKVVLNSITFSLERGGSYAFVGASGAGKSTLLDVLVGLREADAGSFYLDGVQFDPFNTDALRNHIGYVPQNVNLIDESIAFNITFEQDFDTQRLRRAISIARLDSYVNSLPDGLDTVVGESGVRVSGGQKQRIGIARALYRDPQILVFDEATSALDTVTERELMDEINQLSVDKTLIIVAHRLSTVEQCKVIHLLDHGEIIARGTQMDLLATSPEYRALYQQQETQSS